MDTFYLDSDKAFGERQEKAYDLPSREDMQRTLEARHGKELQDRFSSACVAVCGLGGLGSHIALSLARTGIGKLILIDFDRVDISNLHRQQYLASQIGQPKTTALSELILAAMPYTELQTHTVQITEENSFSLLQDADIICEAFDQAEEKAMLVNTVLEQMPDKYLVAASGMAGLSSGNRIQTRRITSRFYLCGDESSDIANGLGLISSRVMLCAAHQAHTVLRILAGELEV